MVDAVEAYPQALGRFLHGDPRPVFELFSQSPTASFGRVLESHVGVGLGITIVTLQPRTLHLARRETVLRHSAQDPLDYRRSIYQDASMPRSKALPAASLHVVLALLDGELHGYALMRRVEELSDGAVRMGPGTLYGTLNRLVDDGLIVETTDNSARGDNERRRYYELTSNGRRVAVDELARLHALVHRTARHLPGGAPA
jgi:DNA-binding PadR family transcriptional regulator